jgi:hypothetical protein
MLRSNDLIKALIYNLYFFDSSYDSEYFLDSFTISTELI